VVDKSRRLTNNEYAHNDDKDQRHVLLIPVFTKSSFVCRLLFKNTSIPKYRNYFRTLHFNYFGEHGHYELWSESETVLGVDYFQKYFNYDYKIPVFTHLRPSSLSALQGLDQLHVEKCYEQQRSAMDDDEVEDVGVDDTIKSIAAEGADIENFLCLVYSHANYLTLVLEKSRDVVDDGEDCQEGHTAACLRRV